MNTLTPFTDLPDIEASVKEAAVSFIADRSKVPTTTKSYVKNLRLYFSWAESKLIFCERLSVAEAMAFKKSLIDQNYADSSVNQILACIKSFYAFMLRTKVIKENPFIHVSNVRIQRERRSKPISKAKLLWLLSELKMNTYNDALNSAIIVTLFFTGLRKAEMLGIRYKDIYHRESGWWVKVIGKGNKERKVPLTKTLEQVLFGFIKIKNQCLGPWHDEDYVFCFESGTKVYPEYINRLFSQISMELGEEITPHSARSSFITFLKKKKISTKVVQTLSGHSSIVTVARYEHVDEEDLVEAVDILSKEMG